jgi:two-component system alkaline phosphatase synthesis response regulator PhoP/two-component system response regulator VicR
MAIAPLQFDVRTGGRGRRVFFADDDPGMRTIVLMNLEAEGFDVSLAADGDEALAEIDRLLPDLIVLDVMMPGRDGFEVLRALKADDRTKGIPVVMLTAKAADSDIWEGWKSGADYYMTKPFDPGELTRFAHQVLGAGPAE